MFLVANFVLLFGLLASSVLGASKNKPHGHNGALDHYNGKPIEHKITAEQDKKLANGEPVHFTASLRLELKRNQHRYFGVYNGAPSKLDEAF